MKSSQNGGRRGVALLPPLLPPLQNQNGVSGVITSVTHSSQLPAAIPSSVVASAITPKVEPPSVRFPDMRFVKKPKPAKIDAWLIKTGGAHAKTLRSKIPLDAYTHWGRAATDVSNPTFNIRSKPLGEEVFMLRSVEQMGFTNKTPMEALIDDDRLQVWSFENLRRGACAHRCPADVVMYLALEHIPLPVGTQIYIAMSKIIDCKTSMCTFSLIVGEKGINVIGTVSDKALFLPTALMLYQVSLPPRVRRSTRVKTNTK